MPQLGSCCRLTFLPVVIFNVTRQLRFSSFVTCNWNPFVRSYDNSIVLRISQNYSSFYSETMEQTKYSAARSLEVHGFFVGRVRAFVALFLYLSLVIALVVPAVSSRESKRKVR